MKLVQISVGVFLRGRALEKVRDSGVSGSCEFSGWPAGPAGEVGAEPRKFNGRYPFDRELQEKKWPTPRGPSTRRSRPCGRPTRRMSPPSTRLILLLKQRRHLQACPVNVLNAGAFGPALRIRRIECPICVMRGSPPPHHALLSFPNIKHTYTITVFIATRRNSKGLG